MNLNLPNKLTVLRVLMIPLYVLLLYLGRDNKLVNMLALIVFIIAALTDTLDGYIARKYNLVTNFGKFMDPLADKLLVCSGLIIFIQLGRINAIIVLIIIAREFIISGFRLVASDAGVVIAAAFLGKIKTVVQMISVILLTVNLEKLNFITEISIWLMLILTILSLVEYLMKNYKVLTN